MLTQFIDTLKAQLQKPLPGVEVQFEMAHLNRQKARHDQVDESAYKQSAVLLLVYPGADGEPSILLIERMSYNGYHSGQIALPGGKVEETDASLEQTALREFFEETGSSLVPEMCIRDRLIGCAR